MAVLGLLDSLKKKRKVDPLKKGTIKFMMADLSKMMYGDLEKKHSIIDDSVISSSTVKTKKKRSGMMPIWRIYKKKKKLANKARKKSSQKSSEESTDGGFKWRDMNNEKFKNDLKKKSSLTSKKMRKIKKSLKK
jgi:hypothetical protein